MFKHCLSLTIAVVVLAHLPLSVSAATLKAGTPIKLRLVSTLDSNHAHEGDQVQFKVVGSIVDPKSKQVLIESNAPALGSITHSDDAGGAGKKGELALQLNSTTAVDKTLVPLDATMSRDGKSRRGSAIALGTVGAVLFLPLAFFFLRKGKEAKLPAGSEMTAYVATDVEISIPGEVQAGPEAPKQPEAQGDYIDEIGRLNKLLQDGAITQEEFETKKKQLLNLSP